MPLRERPTSDHVKILVITGAWILLSLLSYLDSYTLIGDLVRLGVLSGSYAFWPDFWGHIVIGLVGGLVGGWILVRKVNVGYKHRTFLSGIVRSAAVFLLVYVSLAVVLVFSMAFLLYAYQSGVSAGLEAGWNNIVANIFTPSFLAGTLIVGLMVSGTQFMLQVNDKFGPGVLWQLVRGKYYHPRDEERVFMFLDLRSSTEIAEQIGHRRFFELLREVFQDITGPIIESAGNIYQYVGDEVVISWPAHHGIEDSNCIACFYRIERVLEQKRPEYLGRFGVAPDFKAGVHVGEATVGEIGVVKKDIVFSGDVLNTTARIQEECNRYAVGLLASSELLQRLSLAPHYTAVPIGAIQLKGKAQALELSEVRAVAAVA